MKEESSLEHESATGCKALVPTTKEAAKELVVRVTREVLAGTGQHLGVSRNWLIRHVERLELDEEELETFVAVRTEFDGRLTRAMKYLYRGFTVEDIHGCYRVQKELLSIGDKFLTPTVKKIARFIRTFAEADPSNDGLSEMITEAHNIICRRYSWVKYVDQSIGILCDIADTWGCATLDAVLAMVDRYHGEKEGLLSDIDCKEDEIDRQCELKYYSRLES